MVSEELKKIIDKLNKQGKMVFLADNDSRNNKNQRRILYMV